MSIAPNTAQNIVLDGYELTFEQLHRVALQGDVVSLAPSAVARMNGACK